MIDYKKAARECGIPDYMIGSLIRYLENGIEPGSFLQSVIENNLYSAVSCADSTNIKLLQEYVTFMYTYMPSISQGSEENYRNWVNQGGLSAWQPTKPAVNFPDANLTHNKKD